MTTTTSTTTTTPSSILNNINIDDDDEKLNNSILMSKKFTSYHRLVDYFIVCGLGRSIVVNDIDKPYQTEIIDRYPQFNYEDADLPSHIWMFCFPSGLLVKETMEDPTISMFCLTEFDGARFYASSLIYYKEIEKSKMENDQYEQLYKPVSITLLSRYPCYDILKKLLCYIYLYSINNGTDESNNIPIERIISHIVNDLPRPISGFRFKLNLPEIINKNNINNINSNNNNNNTSFNKQSPLGFSSFIFKNGINNNNNNNNSLIENSNLDYSLSNLPLFPSLDIPFSLLFNLIGVNNVILLFSAILQERKILFLSNFNSLLTVACETLVNLLYPFQWPHVYIPILPDLLVDFLQAPTPFIVGMIKHKNHPIVDYSDIFVVDLDLQCIISKPTIEEFKNNIPENECNKLERQIKQILYPDIELLCRVFPSNENTVTAFKLDISTRIRSVFLSFFIKFFYDIDEYRYLLRKYPKSISTFNKSSFLMKHDDPEIVAFLTGLLETSAVTSFFDEDSNNNNQNSNSNSNNSNSNNNNVSISNSSTLFFNLVCKQYKEDLIQTLPPSLSSTTTTTNSNSNSNSNISQSIEYNSVITCILEFLENDGEHHLMMESINIPSPDSSELNPLLSVQPSPRLQFPDLNKSLFSNRIEFSRENIDTKPRKYKLDQGSFNLFLPSLLFSPITTKSTGSGGKKQHTRKSSTSSNDSSISSSSSSTCSIQISSSPSSTSSIMSINTRRASISVVHSKNNNTTPTPTTTTTETSNLNKSNIVISNSKGDVEPVTSTTQLEDDDLLKEYIEKYTEIIFDEDFTNIKNSNNQNNQINNQNNNNQINNQQNNQNNQQIIIDFEQQKLLLDLFKLKKSRIHFMNSLKKIITVDGGINITMEPGWRLLLLIEIMKRIFNECNNAADFKTASSIISSTKDIHFKKLVVNSSSSSNNSNSNSNGNGNNGSCQVQQEPLLIHFFGLRLWRNLYFWESSFLDFLLKMRLESLPESFNNNQIDDWESKSEIEKQEATNLEEETLFKSLSSYAYLMIRLKLSVAETIRFIGRMVIVCNISDEHYNTLVSLVEKLHEADPSNQPQYNQAHAQTQQTQQHLESNNYDLVKNDEISNIIQYNRNSISQTPDLLYDSSGDSTVLVSEMASDPDSNNNADNGGGRYSTKSPSSIRKNNNFMENGDIKYFSSSVKRNIDIEKNSSKLFYQKIIEMKRKLNNNDDDKLQQQQHQQQVNLQKYKTLSGGGLLNTSSGTILNTASNSQQQQPLSTVNLSLSLNSLDLSSLQQQQQQQQQDNVIYDKKDGYSVMTLKGIGSSVTCIQTLNKKQSIINGTTNGNILVWNYNDGKCLQRLTNHKSSVTCIGVDHNANDVMFASGSRDKTLRIWNHNGSEWMCGSTLQEHTDEITSLELKGNTILTGSNDRSLIIWDARSNRKVHRFNGHEGNILSTVMFDSGHYALTTSTDTTARAWDIRTMKQYQVFSEHHDWVTKAVVTKNGNTLFTGSFDCTVKMWDLNNPRSIKTFAGHGGGINAVAFNNESRVLVSGSGDGFLKAWDIQTGFAIKSFKGHKDEILSILYEDETLITSSQDQTIRIWDMNSGVCQKVLRGHTDWIVSLASGSNINNGNNNNCKKGSKFISGSWDSTVRVWDLLDNNNNQQQQQQQQQQQASTNNQPSSRESNRIANVINHQPQQSNQTLSSSLPSIHTLKRVSNNNNTSNNNNNSNSSNNNNSSNEKSSSGGSFIFKKISKPLTSASSSTSPTSTSTPTSTSPTSASTSPTSPSNIQNPYITGNIDYTNSSSNSNNNNNNIPIITTNKVIPKSNNINNNNSNINSNNSNNERLILSSSGGSSSGSETPIGSVSSSLSSSLSSLSSSSSGGQSSWRIGSPIRKTRHPHDSLI